jgi:transposase
MSADKLDALLFPRSLPPVEAEKGKALPDWERVRHELARKGVTLRLLWLEYHQEYPDGYRYTRFCQLYRAWAGSKRVVMRFEHKAGEKTFVDFAGPTLDVVDPLTGGVSTAQIFVAALGASSYTFAHAVPGQDIASWLLCHVRAFRYFGGVSAILVPDNLKAGVSTACRYDPDVNPAYQELAEHYAWRLSRPVPENPGQGQGRGGGPKRREMVWPLADRGSSPSKNSTRPWP